MCRLDGVQSGAALQRLIYRATACPIINIAYPCDQVSGLCGQQVMFGVTKCGKSSGQTGNFLGYPVVQCNKMCVD